MLAKTKDLFLGIEIGGTKLQLVVGGKDGKILDSIRFMVAPALGAEGIQQQIEEGLNRLTAKHAIDAIGVGFGGPLNWKNGTIQVSHQIKGWNNFPLQQWLHKISGKPVLIDNDANVAALAEALVGCGKNFERVFYMTIGSGIGGGLILGGEIYHGRVPGEIEIGHIRLDKHNKTLESACSGWAVNDKIKQYIKISPTSLLATLFKDHSGPEALLLQPALEQKDGAALQIFSELTDDLAFGLSHVIHLLHPDILIIGGGLSLIGESFKSAIEEKIPYYVMKAFFPPPVLHLAELKQHVVPIGALVLAAKAVNS